jgi:GT2 family glycosyltransferase
MEFNLRLKKAGGKILLNPEIITNYYSRSNVKSFLLHNFQNGVWAILPFKYSKILPVGARHLMPLLFVFVLLCLFILSFFLSICFWIFISLCGAYIISSLIISVKISCREKNFKYLLVMPFIFTILHFSYGAGSFYGVFKLFFYRAGK